MCYRAKIVKSNGKKKNSNHSKFTYNKNWNCKSFFSLPCARISFIVVGCVALAHACTMQNCRRHWPFGFLFACKLPVIWYLKCIHDSDGASANERIRLIITDILQRKLHGNSYSNERIYLFGSCFSNFAKSVTLSNARSFFLLLQTKTEFHANNNNKMVVSFHFDFFSLFYVANLWNFDNNQKKIVLCIQSHIHILVIIRAAWIPKKTTG